MNFNEMKNDMKNEMKNIQGPCLPYCYRCSLHTVIFARISMIYIIASIVYLLGKSCLKTPFNDSLTEEQKRIKSESAYVRGNLFITGLLIGILSTHILDLFKNN